MITEELNTSPFAQDDCYHHHLMSHIPFGALLGNMKRQYAAAASFRLIASSLQQAGLLFFSAGSMKQVNDRLNMPVKGRQFSCIYITEIRKTEGELLRFLVLYWVNIWHCVFSCDSTYVNDAGPEIISYSSRGSPGGAGLCGHPPRWQALAHRVPSSEPD